MNPNQTLAPHGGNVTFTADFDETMKQFGNDKPEQIRAVINTMLGEKIYSKTLKLNSTKII